MPRRRGSNTAPPEDPRILLARRAVRSSEMASHVAERQADQRHHLVPREVQHLPCVRLRQIEVAPRGRIAALLQTFAHQERVERGEGVQKFEKLEVVLVHQARRSGHLLEDVGVARLAHEEGPGAGSQVGDVDGQDDLGGGGLRALQHVPLVRAKGVLHDDAAVQHLVDEEGPPLVLLGQRPPLPDRQQIQGAGRRTVGRQLHEAADRTIGKSFRRVFVRPRQSGSRMQNTGADRDRSYRRADDLSAE